MSRTVLSAHTDTHFNTPVTPEPPPSSQPLPAPDSPFSDIISHGAPPAATHEVDNQIRARFKGPDLVALMGSVVNVNQTAW